MPATAGKPRNGKAASGSSGAASAAARAATAKPTQQPTSVEFRGVNLQLPKELPGEFYFAFADLEEDSGAGNQVRMLRALLGDEQLAKVRAKVREDGVPFSEMDTVIMGLFDSALAAYGVTTGESVASSES